ncbi:hypothetical protein PALB_34890 [Pseudoalteromonas luteoviolacea B = ATCC 29581]|nr:hypothetical protein PALB_34890 [Pseudoalteromonas luteoviolacea B = ATCC 29581]
MIKLSKNLTPKSVIGVLFTLLSSLSFAVHANEQTQTLYWQNASTKSENQTVTASFVLSKSMQLEANLSELSQLLLDKGSTEFQLRLPMPDGSFTTFKLVDSPVYAHALQEKYGHFRTFEGIQVDNPEHRGRFDISDQGFHGMFTYQGKRAFIDPLAPRRSKTHVSYFKEDAQTNHRRVEHVLYAEDDNFSSSYQIQNDAVYSQKIYRIAIAAAGEYTAFHGGTKASALSAMVTALNRINEIYRVELGVQLELVANNDTIIFTDPATDPFANDDTDLDKNQMVVDGTIGTNNYDIGHVFNTGGGGVAYLGVVCNKDYKWGGMTGSPSPTADPFVVDYVAHELGHQFSGAHSFNGTTDACSNRSAEDAVEPGSGSTIMAYAGICGEQNLQSNSDAFFHSHSVAQMRAFISQSATCGTSKQINNAAPTVNAGADYLIPANTPFKLTGTGSDPDGDVLTYSWEQFDLGTESSNKATMVDDGTRPLFRAWMPISEPVRYLPRLSDVLQNKTVLGETYPTTARTLNFKLIARDNQGNIATDTMKVSTISGTGAFTITKPKAGEVWAGTETVQVVWNVGQTASAPISCANVDILLASDGSNFSTVLKNTTANDGNEGISVPSLQTDKARLLVRCSDNIFFAVNPGQFTISGTPNLIAPTITGQNRISGDEDSQIEVTFNHVLVSDPDSDYPNGFSLRLLSGNNYTLVGQTKLQPSKDYNGVLSVPVVVNDGKFDSDPFTLEVAINAVNDAPSIINVASIQIDEDSSTTLTKSQFTIVDVDSPTSSLSIAVLNGANYTFNGNTITPSHNFNGTLNVNVVANDGAKQSTVFITPIQVNSINDAPQITGHAVLQVNEDQSLTIARSQVQFSDPDSPLDSLVLSFVAGDNYSVIGNVIKPNEDFNGELQVKATVSDGSLTSSEFTLKVTVLAVNDLPVAADDALIVMQNTTNNTADLLANDSDVDGDTITLVAISYTGTGTVEQTENGINYTPASGFSGQESLNYTISDGNGGEASATLAIEVQATPPPPTPPSTDNSSESSGGGALSWVGLLLGLIGLRRTWRTNAVLQNSRFTV